MKSKVLILAAILFISGCGDFLQSTKDLPPVYESPLTIECMDINNGTLTCTQPVVFLEAATGTYYTRFDHEPMVDDALPITMHLDVRNSGDADFSTTLYISYITRKSPCNPTIETCESWVRSANNITLQPGQTATFDIPVQNPLAGGLGYATVYWSRPDVPNFYGGFGYMYFQVQ